MGFRLKSTCGVGTWPLAWALLAELGLSAGFWSSAAGQEEPLPPFTVVGQVANGTASGVVPAGARIQLVAFGEAGTVGSWEATARADGSFRFEDVPRGEEVSYVIGTEYAGASYVDRLVVPSDATLAPAELTVFESMPTDPGIRFERSALIVSAVDGTRQTVSMVEIHSVSNPTDRTFLPRPDGVGGPTGLLVFGLPQHAFNLSPRLGLSEDSIIQIDRGFAAIEPIRPGRTEIAFSYDFPFGEEAYAFRRTLRYPVNSLRMLAPIEGPLLSDAEGSPVIGRVALGDRDFQEFQLSELTAGDTMNVTLAGLPVRSAPSLPIPLPVAAEPIGAIGAVVGVLVVLVIWWRARSIGSVRSREEIIDALVELESEHQSGKVSQEEYEAERGRLLALAQRTAA